MAGAMLLTACGNDATARPGTSGPTTTEAVRVAPDPYADVFDARVVFEADGIEPATLFVPAGPRIRLVLRNRTVDERHFRVKALPADEVLWLHPPEFTAFDVEQMTPEEQAAIGFDPGETDAEHFVHHSEATFMPRKDVSPAGIEPLPGDVHGYTTGHGSEVMVFYALETGRYEVEDPLRPGEPIGTLVVFAP